jgi:hypothetical protein
MSVPTQGEVAVTVYVISAVPDPTPETTPEAFTVATEVLDDVQVPPVLPLEERAVEPDSQIVVVPESVPASGGATILGVKD